MIVVAALSPALDTTYVVDELVPGRPHRPALVRRVAGGKALNMARAASSLGAEVRAVPVLGGRIGDLVAELLRADGVAAAPVADDAETRVCVSPAPSSFVASMRLSGALRTSSFEPASPLAVTAMPDT